MFSQRTYLATALVACALIFALVSQPNRGDVASLQQVLIQTNKITTGRRTIDSLHAVPTARPSSPSASIQPELVRRSIQVASGPAANTIQSSSSDFKSKAVPNTVPDVYIPEGAWPATYIFACVGALVGLWAIATRGQKTDEERFAMLSIQSGTGIGNSMKAHTPSRSSHVCHAQDPELIRKMAGKGIQLEGSGEAHNAMPGLEFAKKLEEHLTGTPGAEEPGLLSVDGTKASDELELSWDPNNLLGKPVDGLIARRQAQKEAELEQEAEDDANSKRAAEREKLLAMRAARVVPENDPAALAQFFMDTEFNELEYECTRCRPEMTDEFFEYLKAQAESHPEEEMREKFGVMQTEIFKFTKFLDANTQALAAPAERMKIILQALDKKATIMQMASENQIDKPLIALLQTNILLARESGQEEPAMFMEKCLAACKKYAIIV